MYLYLSVKRVPRNKPCKYLRVHAQCQKAPGFYQTKGVAAPSQGPQAVQRPLGEIKHNYFHIFAVGALKSSIVKKFRLQPVAGLCKYGHIIIIIIVLIITSNIKRNNDNYYGIPRAPRAKSAYFKCYFTAARGTMVAMLAVASTVIRWHIESCSLVQSVFVFSVNALTGAYFTAGDH